MIFREIDKVKTVEWGNGVSRRFLVTSDGMGYSLTDTIVRAGTTSRLQYSRHLESCYCVQGTGKVIDETTGKSYVLNPGALYALNAHDAHVLVADPDGDMRLICVFLPALDGDETHDLDDGTFSRY